MLELATKKLESAAFDAAFDATFDATFDAAFDTLGQTAFDTLCQATFDALREAAFGGSSFDGGDVRHVVLRFHGLQVRLEAESRAM